MKSNLRRCLLRAVLSGMTMAAAVSIAIPVFAQTSIDWTLLGVGFGSEWSAGALRIPTETCDSRYIIGTTPVTQRDAGQLLSQNSARSVSDEDLFSVDPNHAYVLVLCKGNSEVEYRVYAVPIERVNEASTISVIKTFPIVARAGRVFNSTDQSMNNGVMRLPQGVSLQSTTITLDVTPTRFAAGQSVTFTVKLNGYSPAMLDQFRSSDPRISLTWLNSSGWKYGYLSFMVSSLEWRQNSNGYSGALTTTLSSGGVFQTRLDIQGGARRLMIAKGPDITVIPRDWQTCQLLRGDVQPSTVKVAFVWSDADTMMNIGKARIIFNELFRYRPLDIFQDQFALFFLKARNTNSIDDIYGALNLCPVTPDFVVAFSSQLAEFSNMTGSLGFTVRGSNQIYLKPQISSTLAGFVLAHELGGHAIGNLNDEYVYPASPVPDISPGLNCSLSKGEPANRAWKDLLGVGEEPLKVDYYPGCMKQSSWRPTDLSLMNSVGLDLIGYSRAFGPLNEQLIHERLKNITGIAPQRNEEPSIESRCQRSLGEAVRSKAAAVKSSSQQKGTLSLYVPNAQNNSDPATWVKVGDAGGSGEVYPDDFADDGKGNLRLRLRITDYPEPSKKPEINGRIFVEVTAGKGVKDFRLATIRGGNTNTFNGLIPSSLLQQGDARGLAPYLLRGEEGRARGYRVTAVRFHAWVERGNAYQDECVSNSYYPEYGTYAGPQRASYLFNPTGRRFPQ